MKFHYSLSYLLFRPEEKKKYHIPQKVTAKTEWLASLKLIYFDQIMSVTFCPLTVLSKAHSQHEQISIRYEVQ